VTVVVPFRSLPADQSDVRYAHGPDSYRQPDVPIGQTIELGWDDSIIYPGTSRRYRVHLPAQYEPSQPASLIVFLDGRWYLDPEGAVRGAIVLDNLIHRGDLPVTIGLFVDPGVLADAENPKNRNVEYDAFDDRLVTFLLTEIIPQVTKRYSITEDADQWGICGGSSGGNGAFTAAWLRPDRFRRVMCCLSSFVQMPGGNPYPEMILNVPRKPLRVLMQAGHRDLRWNEPRRNWLASNLRVAAALAEAAMTSGLCLAMAATTPTMAAFFCPTRCAGYGGLPAPD
jgi:enterochelin esterase-like enzyme